MYAGLASSEEREPRPSSAPELWSSKSVGDWAVAVLLRGGVLHGWNMIWKLHPSGGAVSEPRWSLDDQAIAVPETIDVVRALSGRERNAARLIAATDRSLGIGAIAVVLGRA